MEVVPYDRLRTNIILVDTVFLELRFYECKGILEPLCITLNLFSLEKLLVVLYSFLYFITSNRPPLIDDVGEFSWSFTFHVRK